MFFYLLPFQTMKTQSRPSTGYTGHKHPPFGEIIGQLVAFIGYNPLETPGTVNRSISIDSDWFYISIGWAFNIYYKYEDTTRTLDGAGEREGLYRRADTMEALAEYYTQRLAKKAAPGFIS